MENNDNRLIETLIRGRDSTKRLQNLLRRKLNLDGSSVSAEAADLFMEIQESLSTGISMANSFVSGESYGFPATPRTASVDNIREEVYTGKKPASAAKERRGCYKRRRTIDSSVQISVTTEDGYAWRKYGQKEILNSKFPRCYFRCTHKHVHGCKALKQVQKLEDESNMYHITYLGHHTCPTYSHHEVILDFQDFKNHHINVSNNPSTITNIHINPSVKQEVDSKDQSTDVSENVSSANDENYASPDLRWNEILRGDLVSCHEGASFMTFDHHELDSCASTSSHDYLDIDFLNNDDLLLDHVFS